VWERAGRGGGLSRHPMVLWVLAPGAAATNFSHLVWRRRRWCFSNADTAAACRVVTISWPAGRSACPTAGPLDSRCRHTGGRCVELQAHTPGVHSPTAYIKYDLVETASVARTPSPK
jgi:hypothetical protein